MHWLQHECFIYCAHVLHLEKFISFTARMRNPHYSTRWWLLDFKTKINIFKFFSALKGLASIIKSSIRQCLGSPIFAPSKPLYVILNGFVQSGGLTAERKRNTSYKKNPYSTASHLRKIWAVNLEAVSISNAPTSQRSRWRKGYIM